MLILGIALGLYGVVSAFHFLVFYSLDHGHVSWSTLLMTFGWPVMYAWSLGAQLLNKLR